MKGIILNVVMGMTIGLVVANIAIFKQDEREVQEAEFYQEIREQGYGHQTYVEFESEEEFVDERAEAKHDIEQLELIARVVCSESNNQPFVGKVAVATTVLNRVDYYNSTVEAIVNAPKQYVCGLYYTEECMDAVEYAMNNRDLFPDDMMWFRAGYYHSFGNPYVVIQDHYFSRKE